jgi:fibronectin type 3 domain-containing protein
LKAVKDLAYWKNFEFVAVFRADVMRGNVDYSSQTSQLHGAALDAAARTVQSANMLTGAYTPIAHTWESLIVAAPDTAAPGIPGSPVSTTGADSATFQWSAATDNVGVAGYVVSRDGTVIGRTGLTAFSDSGLKNGLKYSYGIAAYDLSGNPSAPLVLNVSTKDTTPPTMPTGVTATASGKGLAVKWSASSDNVSVSAYQVSRSVDGGVSSPIAKVTAPTTTWMVASAESATNYCFTVTAIDTSALTSAPSAAACLKTPDTTAPSVPAGVSAKTVASQVSVTWAASTDKGGVSGYKVYRSDNGGTLNMLPNPPSGTSYIDSKVSPKTVYSYRISGCDLAGNCSGQSVPAVVTTPAAPDTTAPVVSILSPVRSARVSGTIALTAVASDPAGAGQVSSGIAGVRFQVDGLDVAAEITNSPFTLQYNTKLLPNGTHRVQATARDAAGNKKQSESISITFEN